MFKSAANRHDPAPTAGRRAFVKGMATAVVAIGTGALACGTAHAVTRGNRLAAQESLPSPFPFPLPSVGVEIPCSMSAANVPLQLNGSVVMIDVKGGIRYRVESDSADSLKMAVLFFNVTASSAALGTVILAQSDFSTTPLSTLQMDSSFPPSPQLTTYLDPTLTVEKPLGGGGPLTVQALQPMILIGDNVLAFPPNNLSVNLQAPVPFGIRGATTATLQGFPATMNGSLA